MIGAINYFCVVLLLRLILRLQPGRPSRTRRETLCSAPVSLFLFILEAKADRYDLFLPDTIVTFVKENKGGFIFNK